MVERDDILKLLHAKVNVNGHIVGAAVGSGMTARYATMGGADFLLALSAGRYRIMGRSSFASYLCYGNNNEIVMNMGRHELLPIIKEVPILFGLLVNDPQIHLYEYLKEIKENGFSGIVNFPTVSLFDGQFRLALEEEGNTFEREAEAMKIAKLLNLFTVAFVTNVSEAEQMLEAGADVICVHLGLTKGGFLGAKKYISIEDARAMTENIFKICNEYSSDVIKMVYAGPANTPIDMLYMYQNTECQGYIGGSTFERIPVERAITNTVRAFKTEGDFCIDNPLNKLAHEGTNGRDCVEFVKKYIETHYQNEVQLRDLALVAHVSPSYLSTQFKKAFGISFSQYLVKYRIDRAKELLRTSGSSCKEIAEQIGYTDYAQFSKIFKKYENMSPLEYKKKAGVR